MSPPLVMIVDDDLDIRESLAGLLQDEGYRIVCAENGQDALARLSVGELPRLILLDWVMPIMTGEEFRRAQLENPRLAKVPTAVISMAAPQPAAGLGFVQILPKPLRLERLLGLLERYASPP